VPACRRHRILHLHQDVTGVEHRPQHPDDRDALGKQRGRLLQRGIRLVRSSNERASRWRTGPAGSSITARASPRIPRSCAIWVPRASLAG
jgi:hypothetical protein